MRARRSRLGRTGRLSGPAALGDRRLGRRLAQMSR
jgi:hypothetical protein